MSKKLHLTVNGKKISAEKGASLLETGLQHGVFIPQDCCTGQCGTCRVDVLTGAVDDAGTLEGKSVLACKARMKEDVEIRFDPQPKPMKTSGIVTSITPLAGEIIEVIVEVKTPVPYLAGQYVRVEFSGFPARDYSPTLTLDGIREIHQLVFHIRKLENGVVSSALGEKIIPGRRVKVSGPFGHAFLREGDGRLVFVSTGTGFAPIWSMAVAARLGQPHRSLCVIASARDPHNLYMRPAFEWLNKHGVKNITLAASGISALPPVKHGRATDFLPNFDKNDCVYACGAPEMIDFVKKQALKAGASFYADPFLPSSAVLPLTMRIKSFFKKTKPAKSPVHKQMDGLEKELKKL